MPKAQRRVSSSTPPSALPLPFTPTCSSLSATLLKLITFSITANFVVLLFSGGKTWSQIRSIVTGVTTGQVLWDRVAKVLIMQSSSVDTMASFNYSVLERRSYE
eukprot:SAG22_NODE_950_length_6352_cov_23.892212_5_plen_104_part_00